MTTVLIVVHLMVVLALIGIVLLQRSEGGALGIGGGSGAFMSGRGAGNVLTRSTAVLAAVFFVTSIALTVLARIEARPGDILDRLPASTSAPSGASSAPAAPASTEPPASAADLLKQLGGTASGPQTAPAPATPPAAATAPAAETGPAATTPAPASPAP